MALTPAGDELEFVAHLPLGVKAIQVHYGYADWPMLSVFSTANVSTRYEVVSIPALHFRLLIEKV